MSKDQEMSISEPAETQTKPEPVGDKETILKTELGIPPPIVEVDVKNIKIEDGNSSEENEENMEISSNDASMTMQKQEDKADNVSKTRPAGGTEEVLVKTEEIRIKEEKQEEGELGLYISNTKPEFELEAMKDESSSKKKKKKTKKSKKEKKKAKKARKLAKKKEKRKQKELEKEKKKEEDKTETKPEPVAAQAVEEPPILKPVPAEEDLLYQSNTLRYDCTPNRDFSDFKNVEPTYVLEDSNVDEMSPWKTRRCVGPILDFVKEQKAKGLDLDVPYEGQEVIKAPDPPKKPTPEFRVPAGGGRIRRKGKGRGSARSRDRGEEEKDEYASLLSDFVQKKEDIDYF